MRPFLTVPILFVAAWAGAALAPAQTVGAGATVTLAPEIVTASRTPQPPAHAASTIRLLAATDLEDVPAATLDGQLRSVPGFSLFRRSDSLTANPTAQGVSLRGLGPSGASRSLVLLDGVPLNDPFGGWVAWTKVPREGLRQVEMVPGGGATAWGNSALGGVVQVLSAAPNTAVTRVTATAGDFGTRAIEFTHTQPGGSAKLDLATRAFATDGFSLVAPERRGPIDVAAWSRHHWLSARWRQPLGDKLALAVSFRDYEEKRGNGTPYQHNATREKFGSVAISGQPADAFAWQAIAYAQDQSFASTFGSINAARTTETPASDQFAVPARALGLAWTGTWRHSDSARTSVGGDGRSVRGETREYYTFTAGNFSRLRVAGGRQVVGGLFALHERPLAPDLRISLGARLDPWRDSAGHRRESDRATDATLRDDHYPDRSGTAFSPSLGLTWHPSPAWRLHSNFQRAFRRPTLNELYRPFRIGANVTEANADLRTERVTSAEIGGEYALAAMTLGVAAYWNDLRDAVGNVTIARGPGTFPIVGVLAAGGLGRQRLNLDRLRVRGLELSAKWTPLSALSVTADALVNDATVQNAGTAPTPGLATTLGGKRVAQVPRVSTAVGAVWHAPGRLTLAPRVRFVGRQFEDDENQLTLGAVVVADLSLRRAVGQHGEILLTVENLGNARVETGRSADGVVNTGTPRFVFGGLRGTW